MASVGLYNFLTDTLQICGRYGERKREKEEERERGEKLVIVEESSSDEEENAKKLIDWIGSSTG